MLGDEYLSGIEGIWIAYSDQDRAKISEMKKEGENSDTPMAEKPFHALRRACLVLFT